MERIEFGLSGGLSTDKIQMLHDSVLKLLAEVGVECDHELTIDAVTSQPGVTFADGRLKFSADTVEACIEMARQRGRRRTPEDRIRVTAPWTCFNIIDMDTGEVRASTAADAVSMLKLAGRFNEDGPPPVYPCDLDERIQVLWLEKACLETTPGFGGAMVSHEPDTIRSLGDLYAAAGRTYPLALQFVISPMRFDHLALDLFAQFKEDPKVNVIPSLCPIPVGGLTAPLFASGLIAQSIAESISGMIAADRLGLLGPDILLPLRVDLGDMRTLTVAYSLPDNVMLQVLLRDAGEHFAGYRIDFIYLNTNAKRPDSAAAVDRMAYMLMLGLAGYRHFFMGAGQMSMDEIFSPAQFMIDMEIGRYVQQILDGAPWHGDPDAIAEVVADGVAEGNFLASPTTVEAMRGMFRGKLFQGSNVGQWRSEGAPSVENLALAEAAEAIGSHSFSLDDAKLAAMDRVFEDACRGLGVDLSTQPIPSR